MTLERATLPARVRPETRDEWIERQFETTCLEEAGHAIVARIIGFDVKSARADVPAPGLLGQVRISVRGEDLNNALRRAELACAYLAGPIAANTPVPTWPPRHNGASSDESEIAELLGPLELSEKQYDRVVQVTRDLVEHPIVRAAIKTASTHLSIANLEDPGMVDVIIEAAAERFADEHQDPELKALRDESRDETLAWLRHGQRKVELKALRDAADRIAAEH